MTQLSASSKLDIKKLHVGCGPDNILPDWWNVDIRQFDGIDEVMDVTLPWPYVDTLNFVFGEHFFEQLQAIEGMKVDAPTPF